MNKDLKGRADHVSNIADGENLVTRGQTNEVVHVNFTATTFLTFMQQQLPLELHC